MFLALLAGGAVLRFTRLKKAAPFAFSAALGSLVGFVGANALLALLAYGVGHWLPRSPAAAHASDSVSVLVALAGVGALVVVPVAVSGVGACGGAVAGLLLAWRLRQRRNG